jgi:photosystem II stability/assembly factor-like uncharacterized protein
MLILGGRMRTLIFTILFVYTVSIHGQWEKIEMETDQNFHSIFFVDKQVGWIVGYNGLILKTTDGGENWGIQSINTTKRFWSIYFINRNKGFIGGDNGLLFKTEDGGDTWTQINLYTNIFVETIQFVDENVGWVGGGTLYPRTGQIFKTTNGGETWLAVYGIHNYIVISAFFEDHRNGIAIGSNGFCARTTDGGLTWDDSYLTPYWFRTVYTTDHFSWIVGESGNIWVSSNDGDSWTNRSIFFDQRLEAVKFFNSNTGFVAGSNGLLLRTDNGGIFWEIQNSYTNSDLWEIFFIDEDFGWIVGDNGVLLKYSATPVSVEPATSVSPPEGLYLAQNYPNPFNPTTKIRYSIGNNVSNPKVLLSVYSVLGNEIATLVDEIQTSGNYEVEFNGENLPSGTYLYRLRIGEYTSTHKMSLIK